MQSRTKYHILYNHALDKNQEQKLAITMNENAFNGIETFSKTYVKKAGIHGVPVSGKTHVQQYFCLESTSNLITINNDIVLHMQENKPLSY